jgi:hypothetical protein
MGWKDVDPLRPLPPELTGLVRERAKLYGDSFMLDVAPYTTAFMHHDLAPVSDEERPSPARLFPDRLWAPRSEP